MIRASATHLAWLCSVSIALAGCAGDPSGDPDARPPVDGSSETPVDGTDPANETPLEQPPPPRRELVNETIDYPRAPEEPGETAEFIVPGDAQRVLLRYQPQHDCPSPSLGYKDSPMVTIVNPAGSEESRALFPASNAAGSVDCNTVPAYTESDLELLPGDWQVKTSGVYSGRLLVIAIANPDSPA